MTRHEADRVHEASGIAFTFAGHLVWGNPKLAEGLHGDIEAWRCGLCKVLVVGDERDQGEHAEVHEAVRNALVELTSLVGALARKLDNVSHGAFKPVEVPGAVLSDSPKRNPSATAHEMGADVERLTRVARWRDAAAVREVEPKGEGAWRETADGHTLEVAVVDQAHATAEQLRADGLPE